MKLTVIRFKKNEQCFFWSYIVFMTMSILTHSFFYRYFSPIFKPIIVICIFLLACQEIINKKLKTKAAIGAVILYVVALFLIIKGQGHLHALFACVFVYTFSARDIAFRKIALVTVRITSILLIIIILSSLIGVIPNYLLIEGSGRKRYFLGFRYALNAPTFMFNVIILYIYLKNIKIKFREIVILFLIAFGLYKATDSRLSFYLSVVCLIIALVNKIRKDNFNDLGHVSCFLVPTFILCTIVSLLLTISYSPSTSWMYNLDVLLGKRLSQGYRSLSRFGIGLFGVDNIEWVGAGLNMYGERSTKAYLYVDNLYIQILQRYGIVFFVTFLLFATILMYQCYKKNERLLLVLLVLQALHGLIDDGGIYLHFNTLWILFGPAAFGYLKDKKACG